MDFCKLLVIASTLFFGGVFGQLRFQRHLNSTATTTQNGMEQGLTGMSGLNLDDELVSDNDDKLVLDKPGTVEVELTSDDDLQFEICSAGCLDKTVSVCYEADGKIKTGAKLECLGFNECGFKAGVIWEDHEKFMWFMEEKIRTSSTTCARATMKHPTTKTQLTDPQVIIDSCNPAKRDGKIITLHVRDASTDCPLKVIGAKRWYPTTPAPPRTATPLSFLSTPASKSNETGSSSSNADTTWWIVGGVLAGFLVLLIVGVIGFCVYDQQKKTAAEKEKADRKRRVVSPESLPTLDLTPHAQKEEVKPKMEEAKKNKAEKKKVQTKVEIAPAPPQVLPSKEVTTEDRPKVEPSKEQAAPEIKEAEKENKAPPAKEGSKKAKKHIKKNVAAAAAAPPPPPRQKPPAIAKEGSKHVKKDVVVSAAPPPPPRANAATPKQKSVDATQEESPSSGRQQAALEEGSTSPSIEKKKAPPKKPAKKISPHRSPHRRQRSKKARTRRRSYLDTPLYDMSTEGWQDIQEQRRRRPGKLIEWNPSARSNYK